jgi:hypothetical protein
MSWRTLIAKIINKTGWTFETVRKLTWLQVCDIVFHPRDKHGNIAFSGNSAGYTEEDAFRDRWRAWGLREWVIDQKWREFLEVEGAYRQTLENQFPKLSMEEIDRRVVLKWQDVIRKRRWSR